MSDAVRKPILCIDFDGVIHSYDRGWQDGVIYGTVVPGFFEWAERAQENFTLVVYSSRSTSVEGLAAMQKWMSEQLGEWSAENGRPSRPSIYYEFAHKKPPAFLTIDDRAILFNGDWASPQYDPALLLQFKPWMTK